MGHTVIFSLECRGIIRKIFYFWIDLINIAEYNSDYKKMLGIFMKTITDEYLLFLYKTKSLDNSSKKIIPSQFVSKTYLLAL